MVEIKPGRLWMNTSHNGFIKQCGLEEITRLTVDKIVIKVGEQGNEKTLETLKNQGICGIIRMVGKRKTTKRRITKGCNSIKEVARCCLMKCYTWKFECSENS